MLSFPPSHLPTPFPHSLTFQRFSSQGSLVYAVILGLSAGLILCLGLVHVTPHAIEQLDGLILADSAEDLHDHRRLLLSSVHGHMDSFNHMLDVGALGHRIRRVMLQEDHVDDHDDHDDHAEDLVEGYDPNCGFESHQHPFPLGLCVIMAGFLTMVLMEHLAHILFGENHTHYSPSDPVGHRHATSPAAVGEASEGQVPGSLKNEADSESGSSSAVDIAVDKEKGSEGLQSGLTRMQLMALLGEVGCVFHSVILGISLGVTLPKSDVTTLLITQSIHQLLEGMGLANLIATSGFATLKVVTMCVLYTLTCPIGVAIGIGISDSYDAGSTTARAVEGSFNAISAGMLLYLAMVMILQTSVGTKIPTRHRLLSFAATCLGALAFAILANWV